jgi:hypothetical protein
MTLSHDYVHHGFSVQKTAEPQGHDVTCCEAPAVTVTHWLYRIPTSLATWSSESPSLKEFK